MKVQSAMNFRLKIFLSVFVFINSCVISAAQKKNAGIEIGAAVSSFIYLGDLTPNKIGSFQTIRGGINLQGSIIINNYFLFRTNLAIGGLKGDDAKYENPIFRKQRAFNFNTPVLEMSQLLVWNPAGNNFTGKGFSTYLLGGVGVSFFKIKRDWSNFNAAYYGSSSDLPNRIAIDSVHFLPAITPVFPIGIGFRYALSTSILLNGEYSYRLLFTDYLDGFSQAANADRGDRYLTISIGIIYRLGNKNRLGCPVIKL